MKAKTCHDVLPGDKFASEEEKKIHALAVAIDVSTEEAATLIADSDYYVLTDEEADNMAQEYIEDSLWAFNASVIVEVCNLDSSLEEMIETFCEEKCEEANEAIKSLICNCSDIDDFAERAIELDGRGHFLSSYDGIEIEQDEYFVYRCN